MRRFIAAGLAALAAAGGLIPALHAGGYDETEVSNSGTIIGRVVLSGPLPERRYFPLVLYPFGTFCKKISDGNGNVALQEFLTDAEGGLQDAIVALEGVAAGKRFTLTKTELLAEDCMFHPAEVSWGEHTY
jgi:hypothetical protein